MIFSIKMIQENRYLEQSLLPNSLGKTDFIVDPGTILFPYICE